MDLRRSAKSVLGWAAGVGDRYVTELRSKAVVVAFHRIDDQVVDDPIGCTPQRFERFCRFFGRHFQVVPLSQLLADAAAGRDVGGRSPSHLTTATPITSRPQRRFCADTDCRRPSS